jgi:hypothetical protein
VVVALGLLAFLVMVATAAEMPVEPAKTEPTQPDTEPVVAEVGVVVLVEMGRKVMSALFTGAQTKC